MDHPMGVAAHPTGQLPLNQYHYPESTEVGAACVLTLERVLSPTVRVSVTRWDTLKFPRIQFCSVCTP